MARLSKERSRMLEVLVTSSEDDLASMKRRVGYILGLDFARRQVHELMSQIDSTAEED